MDDIKNIPLPILKFIKFMLFVDIFLEALDLCSLATLKAAFAFLDYYGNKEGEKIAWDSVETDYSHHFYYQTCISQLVCRIDEVHDTTQKYNYAELWDQGAVI